MSSAATSAATSSSASLPDLAESNMMISAKKGGYGTIYFKVSWGNEELEFAENQVKFVSGMKEVLFRGGSHFGSGGYCASATFTPGVKKIASRYASGSFVSKGFITIEYEGSGIVIEQSGDCFSEKNRVTVWGNPDGIKQKIDAIRKSYMLDRATEEGIMIGERFANSEWQYDMYGGLTYEQKLARDLAKAEKWVEQKRKEAIEIEERIRPYPKPLVSKAPMRRL